MIPRLVTVRYRDSGRRGLRLYVPVLPAALVLSPLLLLAVLAGLVACLAFRVSPVGALRGIGQLLWALPGTRIEIAEGQTVFLVSVRLVREGAAMNEQRRQILQMLGEGKITADEAEQLIDALEREQPESPPGAGPRQKRRPKYIRVVMVDNSSAGEPSQINVRVPLQLLRAGVRLTSLIPPQALTKINAELDKKGVPIDLTQLKPQDIEELIDQLDEVTVDINDPDTKMQVFCE